MIEEFPHPKNKDESLVFINGYFQNTKNKEEKLKVLEYSENLEGWSEEHTEMISDHIGSQHPIDIASRDMCKFLLNKNKSSKLIKGYEIVRKLTSEEKQNFNTICRGSALRYLLTRSYDYLNTPKSAVIKIKDPKEYVQKLNFHRNIKSFKEYLN